MTTFKDCKHMAFSLHCTVAYRKKVGLSSLNESQRDERWTNLSDDHHLIGRQREGDGGLESQRGAHDTDPPGESGGRLAADQQLLHQVDHTGVRYGRIPIRRPSIHSTTTTAAAAAAGSVSHRDRPRGGRGGSKPGGAWSIPALLLWRWW